MCTITFEKNKASAVLDVWYDGKTAELCLISSKFKKRHRATQIMHEVLTYVDAMDLEVVLEVYPFTDDHIKMDSAELKAWYMTFGFHLEGDNIMSRKRKSEREANRQSGDSA